MTATATWQHHMLNVYHVDFVSDTEATTLTYHTSHQTTSDGAGHVPQDRRPVLRHRAQGRRPCGRSPTSTWRSAGPQEFTVDPADLTAADQLIRPTGSRPRRDPAAVRR